MKHALLIITIIINSICIAQDSLLELTNNILKDTLQTNKEVYNPLAPPNTYQNHDNPNYWKNKMPHKAYWQQDVYYNIKAKIDEETDIINATQQLVYTNNSPDSLNVVYFHLYQNAFQPDSYLDELQSANKKKPRYGKYESQKLGTLIENITINGENVKTELDNTILKVYLPFTLKPDNSITFNIDFTTYFDDGDVRRRMAIFNSWGYKHYNGVHWYPRICVYDSKFGWTKDQHLGKEFYGNFGTFDVELDFASNFVVEATGFLLNRDEVLPKELREKLDIKNFKDKAWNSTPSIITPYKKGERKIWKFHAENVHDFAFTADPTYRIGESWWEDKVCYSLVQEPHASEWQNAAKFGAECLRVFSEDFGRYVYHKVIVADARSGMEYPMITLDGGSDPGYRDLLAHEIGHMWFFGQIGNNETYRALLDEGFTQFLTAWAMIKIDGEYVIQKETNNKWEKKFRKPVKAIDEEIYYSYIYDATKYNDPVISTHSDGFNGALRHGGGYRHVYYKTAAMLYNLQYVLGDELFLNAMQNYFATWKIAHPYNEDFRNNIINYTKVDLNWFFDQWLESTKRIDYAVKVKGNKITFKRKSRMQMPIDFRVIAKDGKHYDYHIPNNWFIKETNAKVLPKWHAWDLLYPEYSTIIDIPSGIEEVIIDPTNRLADAYMPDNNSKNNITYSFDDRLYQYPDWKNYEIKYRPDLWWNNYDGIKAGINVTGGYLRHHHLFDLNFWINTGLLKHEEKDNYDSYSYRLKYNTNLDKISLNTRLKTHIEFLAGLYKNKLSIVKSDNKKYNTLTIDFLSLYRINKNYLIYDRWELEKFNNRVDVSLLHKYKYTKGNGSINLTLQSSGLGSSYDYNNIKLIVNNNNKFKKFNIKTRAFMQIGSGSNWAEESKLHISGANNEEMMNSKFTRSEGIISADYMNYDYNTNRFHKSGGLNIRGYAGLLVPRENNNGNTINTYNGISGASFNTEIDITNYLPYLIRKYNIKTYFFADAGVITNETLTKEVINNLSDNILTDAGIGFTYTLRKFKPLEDVKPITIRFDLPLFISHPPATNIDALQMRWLIGLNKVL